MVSVSLAALALLASQQYSDAEARKKLGALGAAREEAALKSALESFDAMPLIHMSFLESTAASMGQEVYEAFRRRLPHPAWRMLLVRATVGDARRKEAELLGPDPKARPEDFARAVEKLFDKPDRESRFWALRLFQQVRAPAPEKLAPFLKDPDAELALAAAGALSWTGDPAAEKAVFEAFKAAAPEAAIRMTYSAANAVGAEATPELVKMIEQDPARARAAAVVLQAVGDARAEPALLALVDGAEEKELWGRLEALSLIGGEATIARLREYAKGLPEGDRRRPWVRRALVRLRAPGIAGELLAGARAGREKLAYLKDELEALGDRSIVPELVRWSRDPKAKADERKAAIELLGAFGGPLDVLVEHLADERLEEAAARALGELEDPRAARPLAESFKTAEFGHAQGRALLLLPGPLEGIEDPILDVLNDPEGHSFLLSDAVKIAARTGSPRLKEKLLWLLTQEGVLIPREEIALALVPRLAAADRERLVRGRSSKVFGAAEACMVALAGMGDADALQEFVKRAAQGRFRDPMDVTVNPLRRFPVEPPGLVEAVEAQFRANPSWLDGAEFLSFYGKREGLELLKRETATRGWKGERAGRALLRLGERSVIPDLLLRYEGFHYDPEEEKVLAAALDEEGAARLRLSAWSRRAQVNHPSARILALRGDREMLPFFLRHLRREPVDNEVSNQANDGPFALCLAKAGAPGMKPILLRWLRSTAASRRALAARCLGILEERSAIHAIVPLLDDLGEIRRDPQEEKRAERARRVREDAVEAIERLSGQKFPGAPAARAAAAREWYLREKRSIR